MAHIKKIHSVAAWRRLPAGIKFILGTWLLAGNLGCSLRRYYCSASQLQLSPRTAWDFVVGRHSIEMPCGAAPAQSTDNGYWAFVGRLHCGPKIHDDKVDEVDHDDWVQVDHEKVDHVDLAANDYDLAENYDVWGYRISGRVYKYVYFDCCWHPWGPFSKLNSQVYKLN